MRVNINSLPDGYKVLNGKVIKTMALGGIPRTHANLEAEKGETALTDLDNDGVHELYTIGGNRHSSGGTPLNLPPQSFIFSDTAKMKFNTDELAKLGVESSKKQTPAWVSKKHPLNKFIQGMDDEHSDNISDETSELMLHKNKLQLSKIAFMQEAKKDFLDEEGAIHVPLAAYPFLISKGVNPEEFVAKLEEINNQKKEAQSQQAQGMQQGPPQGMPPQGMPPQGGPMHQMPDSSMMPGASHGAPPQGPPQGPPMMNDGGEMQQLMQQVSQALQQGAKPEQIMQQLVEMGMPEQQAMQMLQQVIQSIQGQQGQQGPPMMRHGGDPFSNNPLHQFVYGGQEPLRQYQGSEGSSEIPDTFRGKVGQESWTGVRSLWYKSYMKAIEDYNATAAGKAKPIVPQEEAEAFEAFYAFNEMNDSAEEQNLNYDPDCARDANGKRPNTEKCKHNDPNGKDSYNRMKKNGLIGADVTKEQYGDNTIQFQAMYAALGDIQNNPDTSDSDLALLKGLPMATSAEKAWGARGLQHGKNVSALDRFNGVLTSSSHAAAVDDPGTASEEITYGCPDEEAKSAECAARNAEDGATAPLFNPPPEGAAPTNVRMLEGQPNQQIEREPIDKSLAVPEPGTGPEVGPATDSPVETGENLDQAQEGIETGGTWTWSSETCQCVQGPGGTVPGEKPKKTPWIQDQNNLNQAMRNKSAEEDQNPMMQKLNYNPPDLVRHDPLTAIHANNSLASGLGENATHAEKMDLFTNAATANQRAVQSVQDADAAAYNQYSQANAAGRARVDAANSGFASKYVDDTNMVQANRVAKDQAHDDNINKTLNDLLTHEANTYNQNSLYPNYNIRPDQAGAIEFANPQAIRDEQSQTGNARIRTFQEWKDAYPDLDNDQIIVLMGKAEKTNTGGSRNQPPGGYQGPTGGTAKYGTEMRDLEANRKALRRWILGIQ